MSGEGAISAKQRRFIARRQQIIDVALDLAERDGWAAVTTRRLAQAIDYSQPVIYQHFASRDQLLRAIAIDGFASLADQLQAITTTPISPSLEHLCRTYLEFAQDHPARYEAMFSAPTSITFDAPDTPEAPQRAFSALRSLIAHQHPEEDPDTAAELFWAACHGLATLIAAGRIPNQRLETHIDSISHLFNVTA